MRQVLILLAMLVGRLSVAQVDSANIPFSENGWQLSPHGTIRILVLYAEVLYDRHPEKDPQPDGSDQWPKGRLPKWKDNVFDPFPLPEPKAMVSRYYHDVSLGNFVVLGDHVDAMLTIRESDHQNLTNLSGAAIAEANKLGVLKTAHGLSVADFDLWKDGGKAGLPKAAGPDTPHSYDHVMTILRNSWLTHGQGSTDPGSSGNLYGISSDTQSRFGGMNALPFEILKHEFNHLLLGGNNFHSGGGNASQFESYFIPLQGGWSLMGAASSSLLTCSAWDRDRLGWRADDARFRINARDLGGTVVSGDLDPAVGDTGLFVLRDFVNTGDALRIRMPHLADDEFPQWIWLENHQTQARNGSPTDRFHYEEIPCVRKAVPGLYAMLQVDRDQKRGKDIYGGRADYLRAIPAGGNFDFRLRGDTITFQCLWPGPTQPLIADDRWANPLSGAHELEIPVFDTNGDGKVSRSKEGVLPRVMIRNGVYMDEGMFFGHAAQAFTPAGNGRLGMGTNPALANMMTLVSTPGRDMLKGAKPNVRAVHLAGLSVTLLEQRADGSLLVRVSNNDTRITRDVRWCADSIVVHAVHGHRGHSLFLDPRVRITVDRSLTPTHLDRQTTIKGTDYFSGPTRLTLAAGASAHLAGKARIELKNASELHLMNGSRISLDPGALIAADATSRVVLHGDARIDASVRQLKKLRKKGRLVSAP